MTSKFLRSLALAALVSACSGTASFALDRHVVINNKTTYDITEFYASNTGTANWEEDILGVDVLPAGSSVNIDIDDGTGYCKFDFRAVFSDGTDLVTPNNNVCELSEFNITE